MRQNIKRNKFFLILTILFIFLSSEIYSEILTSPTWGFSVDLPEGFVLADSTGNDSFLFQHKNISVQVILRAFKKERYATTTIAMDYVMKQLSATYDTDTTDWRNTTTVISSFDMTLNGESLSGWGVCSELPDSDGIIVMLSYGPKSQEKAFEPFIVSTIDSLAIDLGSFYEAGPITHWAYPKTGNVKHNIEIAGKKIQFTLDSSDIEAENFLIEREYGILVLYQSSDLWKEAWQRYYRQIFRNACSRIKNVSFSIGNALLKQSKNDKELIQTLLTWVQYFEYDRQQNTADLMPVTAVLTGEGSDCDSRSILLAIILYQLNYDTCLFISADYSHAMLGVVLDEPGAKITRNEKTYLLGETTGKVEIGQIANTMADETKWIEVDFIME